MQSPDETELIIDGLFSEGIIAYNRALGHAVGDVVAALLLSQLWYWSKRQPKERDGWFYMTREQIRGDSHDEARTRICS